MRRLYSILIITLLFLIINYQTVVAVEVESSVGITFNNDYKPAGNPPLKQMEFPKTGSKEEQYIKVVGFFLLGISLYSIKRKINNKKTIEENF